MCSSYRYVGASGGLAGLVLPLSKCLVTGIPSLIGSSWEKEHPSLTVQGFELGTPMQGFEVLKAVPAVMDR